MSASTDSITELDVDLDNVLACRWSGCKAEPTWMCSCYGECGCEVPVPVCTPHKDYLVKFFAAFEDLLAFGVPMEAVNRLTCLGHGAPIHLRGVRPL